MRSPTWAFTATICTRTSAPVPNLVGLVSSAPLGLARQATLWGTGVLTGCGGRSKTSSSLSSSLRNGALGFAVLTRISTRPRRLAGSFFHIMGALVEFERNLVRERTRAGLMAAKRRGRLSGPKRRFGETHRKVGYTLLKEGELAAGENVDQLKVSPATIYRYFPGGREGIGDSILGDLTPREFRPPTTKSAACSLSNSTSWNNRRHDPRTERRAPSSRLQQNRVSNRPARLISSSNPNFERSSIRCG